MQIMQKSWSYLHWGISQTFTIQNKGLKVDLAMQ